MYALASKIEAPVVDQPRSGGIAPTMAPTKRVMMRYSLQWSVNKGVDEDVREGQGVRECIRSWRKEGMSPVSARSQGEIKGCKGTDSLGGNAVWGASSPSIYRMVTQSLD